MMQTLAQALIYGSTDDVARFIDEGINLNELTGIFAIHFPINGRGQVLG